MDIESVTYLLLLIIATTRHSPVHSFFVRPTRPSIHCLSAESTLPDAPQQTSANLPWPVDVEANGPFQQDRDWGFAYSAVVPDDACTSYEIDDIEGKLPSDLKGTYYKIGPGNFERGGQRYTHILDGDGFVASFSFDGSSVTYTGRFVETEFFKDEQTADAVKYRSVFGTQRSEWFKNVMDLTLKNVANTNILAWGGRLLALFEAGVPHELDPKTLAVLPTSFDMSPYVEVGSDSGIARGVTIDQGGPVDQVMKSTGKYFTAHPHIVDNDTLVAFLSTTSVKDSRTILEFVEYDRQWKLKSRVPCSFHQGPAPHDFALSDRFYLFLQNPFGEMDNLSYALGIKGPAQIMKLTLREPTVLHLVDRTTSETYQVELPSYFNIHMVPDAQETTDGKLILYSNGWDMTDERFFPQSQETVPFLGAWGGPYPDFDSGRVPPSYLYRTVIDLETKAIMSHKVVAPGHVIEFPLQDATTGMVYCSIASADDVSVPGTGFCRFHLDEDDSVDYWWAPYQIFTGEIYPVPKEGSTGSWLLGLLYDAGKRRTSLAIFDSDTFTEGPICQLHLRHHLTYGLHGTFAQKD